jgi:hypothetical protein
MQTRRQFLTRSALLSGSSFLHPWLGASPRSSTTEPKYLIQIHYDLGLSTCAMFDARPNIFTATGVFHNYLLEPVDANNQDPLLAFRRKEAIPYPAQMGKGYYSPILDGFIREYGKDIAIVNGVHMSENDGHNQNAQAYLTGGLQRANLFLDFTRHLVRTNTAAYAAIVLRTSGFDVAELAKYLMLPENGLEPMLSMFRNKAPKVHFDRRFSDELKSQFQSFGTGKGAVEVGASELWKAGLASDELIDVLRSKQIQTQGAQSTLANTLSAIHDSFSVGLSNHAVLQLAMDTDTHFPGPQRQKLQTIVTIGNQLNDLLRWLKNTEAPDRRSSMFEQTVVTVAGEFDRTTRQDAHATGHSDIFATGSDHNQYSNTVLVFGGGIKGGQVIGESDLDVLDPKFDLPLGTDGYGRFSQAAMQYLKEERERRFPAHMKENSVCNRVLGKPWDFANGKPLQDVSMQDYDRDNYITIQSIHNTILEHFGFREAFHHANSLDKMNKAKIIPRLLG